MVALWFSYIDHDRVWNEDAMLFSLTGCYLKNYDVDYHLTYNWRDALSDELGDDYMELLFINKLL